MTLTERQKEIIDIVRKYQPITGKEIGERLYLTRSALRTDFSILTKMNILESKPKIGYSYIEKKDSEKVKDIMSPSITVDTNLSVYETILNIFSKDVGTIFITEQDSLVGVVSRKDLLKIAIGRTDIEKIPINIIMTRMPNIIYAEENETILESVKKLIKHQIDSLPVVRIEEKNGKKIYHTVGRLTKTNITKLFMETLSNN
ncbi:MULTISPECIES: CBS domain-containing protein [Fusobacterium]|uniref:CBS domain-containing protein n=1 Tax=Fusobacterium varium ATCC 27725 TaxID=469618 RepID=A0ABM6U165_FUSVA|nr:MULTISPECIES: CBS domain-containing protein [Fusobacterium]AVQ30029.1 CBS domain-containing protein [Fusobacterium varium ATCC 27725]MCF0170763.1 CBS domain-containing protein [Fusobacterium varium]MCF2673787.1 CBS domain-containing protein [Fusobacterium varium]MCI6031767.1 helix-turn-helix transcriptional regulator [Fusobacterium varium]MDY4004471.1 CBS domain-containing protein [Fusobacterium varium]